ADHLEVLEGPSRPSADFFHTRTSRCASPRAWVNSATSASSCCSRVEGPDFPAARPVLPASRNARFQFPTDCSDTFARRAASATVTSPAKTDNTILVFSSAGTAGGLAMNDQTPHRSGPQATGPATKSDARHPDVHGQLRAQGELAEPFNQILNPALRLHAAHAASQRTIPANAKRPAPKGEPLAHEPENREPTLAGIFHASGFTPGSMVELRGFEPLTSSMPWKRATNCAIAPRCRAAPTSVDDPGGLSQLGRVVICAAPHARPGRRRCRPRRQPVAPTLCCARRHAGRPERAACSTDQWQFPTPVTPFHSPASSPSSALIPAPIAAPCVTTTRVSSSSSAAACS